MKKKEFFVLMQKDDIVGIKKQNGYLIDVAGEKLYAYKSKGRAGWVYIIDPKNGTSIFAHESRNYGAPDEELIGEARHEFIASGAIETYKKLMKKESYRLVNEAFDAFRRAYLLLARQEEVALREQEIERRRRLKKMKSKVTRADSRKEQKYGYKKIFRGYSSNYIGSRGRNRESKKH